jgi:peptidoglycan lytic transglycosylase
LNSLTKALITLVMVSLVGFTYMSENKKNNESAENSTTTVNNEEILMNTSLVDYVDKGMMKASWYGPKFHGKITANGEHFDQMAFTAAHKKLKFGTLLRITNPKNDKSVVVRINDRGPYISGRQLDLSKAAAQELGMIKKGVVKLKVEEITLKGINFPVISLN